MVHPIFADKHCIYNSSKLNIYAVIALPVAKIWKGERKNKCHWGRGKGIYILLEPNFNQESYDPRKDLIESIECPKTISVKVLESTEAHKDLSKFNVKFRLPLDLRKLEDISGKSFYYLLNGPFLPKMTFLEWNWRFWIFDKIFLFRKIIIYLLQIKILKIFKNLRDETERKNSHYYCLHDKSRDHEKRLDVSHVVAAFN